MTQIISAFAEIAPRYRALFCDLWGCVHDGKKPFPGAIAALQAFRAQGGVVVLVSNAPRPKPGVLTQLDRIGVPRDAYDEVVTSGDATQYAFLSGAVGHKVHHIGPMPKDQPFFDEFADPTLAALAAKSPVELVPLDQAEGILCTGPNDDLNDTPADYRAAFLLAKTKGLKMLCANPDLVVDFGDKRIYCAGALAALYEEMGGEALYFGKPHPPIYDLARRRLADLAGDLPNDAILCIGDGISTDVLGAMQEGLDSLFLTEGLNAGQFGPADALNAEELHSWLADGARNPTYVMGMLR
ncbi:TIGR01459 family HAD-type hydrolase [Pseudorhodobacter turbinis]|uniref:TIGR01459 family HAD-type hydrolase n=1 Tax=Pseudorhodobacter turbinis TaxID=2500533 RepID=A0A4P8EGV6_9RHOB|nr:TIGR01459 family HAD-type hydrolase [Pseudorhodobacter turbinis]QCO56391.1 TIGR01459 family HAD-type hydrolase [Pseudorhodobacter turbinis]